MDRTRYRIALMGQRGLLGRTIQRECRKHDGETFSLGHIYGTLRKDGIRIRDYREGEGEWGKEAVQAANFSADGGNVPNAYKRSKKNKAKKVRGKGRFTLDMQVTRKKARKRALVPA